MVMVDLEYENRYLRNVLKSIADPFADTPHLRNDKNALIYHMAQDAEYLKALARLALEEIQKWDE